MQLGYGAYLAMTESDLLLDELQSCVKLRRFENTSSTKLELQTLLWPLSEIQDLGPRLRVHTDSQNIIGLSDRRVHLEQNRFRARNNRLLNNHELYREFYRLTDQLDCEWIKVRAYQPSQQRGDIERLFALVDRASRKALREALR